MKRTLRVVIGLALLVSVIPVKAQATNTGGFWETIGAVLNNNPTNSWDVSAYAVYNLSGSQTELAKNLGGGLRAGYWLNPSVGAALDVSYCDRNWTLASLSLQARGTLKLKGLGSLMLYGMAGPGWNIATPETGIFNADSLSPSVVAVAGAGGAIWFEKFLPKARFFGEYVHVGVNEPQNRIQTGMTRTF